MPLLDTTIAKDILRTFIADLVLAELEKRCGMALRVIYQKLKADGKPEHQVRPYHRGGRKR